MKNKMLVASLLTLLSTAALAQTAPTASKPTSTPSVSVAPAVQAVPSKRLVPDLEQMAKQQIARFDSNKDGKVSAAEFVKPAQESFKRTDLNKDGFVTPLELVESNKRQREELSKQMAKISSTGSASATVKPAAAEKPAK